MRLMVSAALVFFSAGEPPIAQAAVCNYNNIEIFQEDISLKLKACSTCNRSLVVKYMYWNSDGRLFENRTLLASANDCSTFTCQYCRRITTYSSRYANF